MNLRLDHWWQVKLTDVSSLSASPATAAVQSKTHWSNLWISTVHCQSVPQRCPSKSWRGATAVSRRRDRGKRVTALNGRGQFGSIKGLVIDFPYSTWQSRINYGIEYQIPLRQWSYLISFRGKSEDAGDTEEPCVVRMLTFLPGLVWPTLSPTFHKLSVWKRCIWNGKLR